MRLVWIMLLYQTLVLNLLLYTISTAQSQPRRRMMLGGPSSGSGFDLDFSIMSAVELRFMLFKSEQQN